MKRRSSFLILAFGMVVALMTVAPSSRAETSTSGPSGSGGSFSGTASADGVRVTFGIPDYLIIDKFVDGGGPAAQASLDSLGNSTSFASLPYPGDTGVTLTGLVSVLTGKSLPSYPFYISTSYPAKTDDHIDQPGYHLATHSGTASSSANAQLGEQTTEGTEAGVFSTASVTQQPDGTLVAQSRTHGNLSIGPLQITGLDSTATVERTPDGSTKRTSSLKVGYLKLAGVPMGVTDHGFVVGQTTLPINPPGGLTQVLSTGDTTVQILPASKTADSILVSGLLITSQRMLPTVGHPVQVSITVGRAFASADAAAGAGVPAEVGLSLPLVAPSIAPSGPGTTGVALGGLSGSAIFTGADSPVIAPLAKRTRSRTGVVLGRRGFFTVSSATFYPVFGLAGLIVLLGSLGLRSRTVRSTTWNS